MISVRQAFGHGADSLEAVRHGLGVPRPMGVKALAESFGHDIVLSETIVTDEPLGGDHSVVLRRDGTWRYQGHMRATGVPSFEVSVLATVGCEVPVPGAAPGSQQLAFAAHGECHGTNELGDRDFSWDQQGHSDLLAAEWPNFRRGILQRRVEFDTDWFGVAGEVASFLGQVVVLGSTFGAAGVAIVLAGETAEQLELEGLVLPGTVGILLAGGAGFVFGPGAMFPVFLIGATLTAALVRQRELTGEERTFVDQVYRGSVPLERVRITNLVGFGGRPFTCPGPGGVIIVNIGQGYDDPVHYTGSGDERTDRNAAGQLLIHELAHAWQIANETFTPAYYCKAVDTALGTVGTDKSAYTYGPADRPWGAFGTEQQASILDEWFAGKAVPKAKSGGRQAAYDPMREDDTNPFFRYIRDNVRAGIA